MRFSLSPDQVAFRDAIRDLLAAECPPPVVRAAWTDRPSERVWAQLAELGLFGAVVAEADGGLGLDEADLVPLLMELGYAAVPHPVAETMAVAAPLRPELAAGKVKVALAGQDGLTGFGAAADLIMAITDDGVRLAPAASATSESTVDGSRPVVRVTLADGGVLVADPELVQLTRQRAELATAAQLVGLGRRMLDLTTAYVVDRRQFGVPVGSFQAVKHRLADALLGLEFAAPAVLAAGWELSQRSTQAAQSVSLAAVLAAEAATEVAKAAIQCHGAIAYTVEYDLHLYAKRTWALAATVGIDGHLDRLADALELTKGAPA